MPNEELSKKEIAMAKEIEDLKVKLNDCEGKLRRCEDDLHRIRSGCSPLYYTMPYQRY